MMMYNVPFAHLHSLSVHTAEWSFGILCRFSSFLIIDKSRHFLPVALVQVPNDLVLVPQHLPEQEDCMEH